VLGSYGFDRNPVGLYEFALKSIEILENYKEQNTKKVPKKLIDSIQKAVNDYTKANQR
jgi:translation initiation factor 2B subunit (eIF-2B alpha/beta/delta family)